MDSPPLTRELEALGATVRQHPPGNWGEWVRDELEELSGEVITFLDDDDVFESERLAAADAAFREDPRLGYWHNRAQRFVTAGDSTSASRRFLREPPYGPADGGVTDARKERRLLERLFWQGASFNNSSIAVRREVLRQLGARLAEVETSHSLALYCAALTGPWDLFFEPRPLTLYRVHARNRSPGPYGGFADRWRTAARDAPFVARDADRLARYLESDPRSAGWTRPLRAMAARHRLVEATAVASSRGEIARRLTDYFANEPARSVLRQRQWTLLATVELVAPRLTRRLLAK